MVIYLPEAADHLRAAVAIQPDPLDKVGTGQRQIRLGDRATAVVEQVIGIAAEEVRNSILANFWNRCSHKGIL